MVARSDEASLGPTVAAIARWNAGLSPTLVAEKYRRMRADLFAFFRGTNHLFVDDWAELAPADPGPALWLCGDLHPNNFGCFRADDGTTVFDVNDFDEAIVAPCAVDLVRCSTGIILGGEVWGHSPIRVMRMVLAYLDGYRAGVVAMTRASPDGDLDPTAGLELKAARSSPIADLILASGTKTQGHLLERMTRINSGGERVLKGPARFNPVGWGESKAIVHAIQAYGRSRGEAHTFQVVDFAARVAGIGSLGVRRYVALVAGDGQLSGYRLFDIKEAAEPSFRVLAAAQGLLGGGSVAQARRIVDAQRRIQARPTAGLDVLEVDGVGYRLRELIPEESRARLDQFRQEPSRLRRGIDHAGWITAHAHLRGAVVGGDDRADDLATWVRGSALDAVLAASVRLAERNRAHYKAFRKAKLDPTAAVG